MRECGGKLALTSKVSPSTTALLKLMRAAAATSGARMKLRLAASTLLGVTAIAPTVAAQTTTCVSTDDTVCLPRQDFQRFLDIALERQCLEKKKPVFEVDPITVVTDSEGRVFYTGADPNKPYRVTMSWCHYEVEAVGKVSIVAAMKEPATSGLRFRPKAYLGHLPLKLAKGKFHDGIDAGLLVDWLFIHDFNLNVAAGFRSLGLGVGVDLTKNFGVYAGYAIGYTAPTHNVNASIYFSF